MNTHYQRQSAYQAFCQAQLERAIILDDDGDFFSLDYHCAYEILGEFNFLAMGGG